MKTRAMLLIVSMMSYGLYPCFAADEGDEPSKADIKRMDDAKKRLDESRKDPEKRINDRINKMIAEWNNNPKSTSSGGGCWSKDGKSHVVDCLNGKRIDREFYTNGTGGCSISSGGKAVNGVYTYITTIKNNNGQLLETITWKKNGATITDSGGKVIDSITFK